MSPRAFLLLTLLSVAFEVSAAGDGAASGLELLADQLEADDVRLRVQAALLLGRSGRQEAIPLLCRAVRGDESATVKAASARGLRALGFGSARDCPQGSGDTPSGSHGAMESASDAPSGHAVHFRVKRLQVSVPDDALSSELRARARQLIEARLRERGAGLPGTGRTGDTLPGYELELTLSPLSDDGLRLRIVCFRAPNRELVGSVSVRARGARHERLLGALVPKLVQEAAETFGWPEAAGARTE